MNSDCFSYRVYGLTIESEFPVPQFRPYESSFGSQGERSVKIRMGSVPDFGRERPTTAEQSVATRFGDSCLIQVAFVGDFLVTSDSIVVQMLDDASMDDLLVYLAGTVMAAVVHLRNAVPLHVSAVLSPTGAIAFTGASGAGKSTIAAHFHRATLWPLISDDVATVAATEQEILLESGVLTVKLWEDTLGSLERSKDGLKRDLQRFEKFHAIDAEHFVTGRHPLKALVQLEWGDAFQVNRVEGAEAFKIALGSVYRPELMNVCGSLQSVTTAAIQLAKSVEIIRMTRRKNVPVSDGILDSIEVATRLGNSEAQLVPEFP